MAKCSGLLLVAALAVSCAIGGGGGPNVEEKELGHSGYVVDAPTSWKVEAQVQSFYTITGAGPGTGAGTDTAAGAEQPGVQVTESFAMPPSVEELASQVCDGSGQGEVIKEALPDGGFFVQCARPSRATGATTTRIEAVVPAGNGKALRCHLETDRDPTAAAAICRSLRKK